MWSEQYRTLGALENINSVQIFENRGDMMGASNPHPHCQIWATHGLPNETGKELSAQTDYRADHGSCLLCDYLRLERQSGERIVFANDHFTVLVPFWAIWPFETMVLAHRHIGGMDDLTAAESHGLAEALSALTIRYDNLFQTPFPYSMGFHPRPTDGQPHPEWHLHAHFLSAAAPLGDRAEVHGRLRAARLAAARPDRGERRGAPAPGAGDALPRPTAPVTAAGLLRPD